MQRSLPEQQGDLFDVVAKYGPHVGLGHGVNCAGAMGRGIAVEFKRRWPTMYTEYQERCQTGALRPGGVFAWQDPLSGRWVYNLATQAHWRTAATLDAIRNSVTAMVGHAAEHDVSQVALPRIGAGLGGLDWDDVAAVLDDVVTGQPVVVGIVTLPR